MHTGGLTKRTIRILVTDSDSLGKVQLLVNAGLTKPPPERTGHFKLIMSLIRNLFKSNSDAKELGNKKANP